MPFITECHFGITSGIVGNVNLSHSVILFLEHTEIKVINLFIFLFVHFIDDGLVGQCYECELLLLASKEEQSARRVDQIAIVQVGATTIAELELVDIVAHGSGEVGIHKLIYGFPFVVEKLLGGDRLCECDGFIKRRRVGG